MNALDSIIDYLIKLAPTVLGIAALYFANRNISVQIDKNRRAKWIDDFRAHTAVFIAAISSYNMNPTIASTDRLRESGIAVLLFTNPKIPKHNEFSMIMAQILLKVEEKDKKDIDFAVLLDKLGAVAIEIIQFEQEKI